MKGYFMKWWESNHLEHTQLNYFQHYFLPFLPIEIIYKIKEMFEHNYSTKPD